MLVVAAGSQHVDETLLIATTLYPHPPVHKSDNLQYNTLCHWVAGTNDSSTKCLMFQVLFSS